MRTFHLLTEGYAGDFGRELTRGRMDEVARFVHNALFLSHSLRRDVVVRITLFKGPMAPLTITIRGDRVRGLHPDEGSIGGFLRKAILTGGQEGVEIERGFGSRPGVILDEKGEFRDPRASYFYIGGPQGFPVELDLPRVSLGGRVYTASQTVCIVNYLLDVGLWTLG